MKEITQQGAQLNMDPLVTIWTPCYNHEQYLDDYFQGLLSQTYSNIQLILIDDGSTDGSWAKIRSYENRLRAKFPHVVLERHENIGPTEEFLAHFWKHATGEYTCVLESDDYFLPTKIEENIRYFQAHPDVGAVHSEVDYVYPDHIEYHHWETTGTKIPEGDIFDALLRGNFIMTCSFICRTVLMRKHVDWRRYMAKGYIARDYSWFLDLARHTRFGYIEKSLVRYRILSDSWSHSANPLRTLQLRKNYYQIQLDYIEQYGAPDQVRNAALRQMHLANFLISYEFHIPEQFRESYAWLLENDAPQFNIMGVRLRALAMKSKPLWRMLRGAEQSRIIQRPYRLLRKLLGLPKSAPGVTTNPLC